MLCVMHHDRTATLHDRALGKAMARRRRHRPKTAEASSNRASRQTFVS
jgi:hypothetical protein